jgi:hypothetical protein
MPPDFEGIAMDPGKIDPALAFALQDVSAPDENAFVVFIHTARPPGPVEKAFLEQRGVRVGPTPWTILTATLSRRAVEDLSDQPWVRSIKLSAKLRPSRPH